MTENTEAIASRILPQMTSAGLQASTAFTAIDEFGQPRDGHIAAERAITVYLDKKEIVTLMTLGTQPELLVLGWLRNQRLVPDISHIKAIQVDWETGSAVITTYNGVEDLDVKLGRRTVTTGCGQGTVFGSLMDDIDKIKLPQVRIRQSTLYELLNTLSEHNEVYKRAGAVHGCALCKDHRMLHFVEDVGRHNAVDAIAGQMWLNDTQGHNKLFYTTGRLTSEMVIKVAQMGVPVLLSRSGVTEMGQSLAKKIGVMLIARAKGKHFLVYNGSEQIEFDAMPDKRPIMTHVTEHRRP